MWPKSVRNSSEIALIAKENSKGTTARMLVLIVVAISVVLTMLSLAISSAQTMAAQHLRADSTGWVEA